MGGSLEVSFIIGGALVGVALLAFIAYLTWVRCRSRSESDGATEPLIGGQESQRSEIWQFGELDWAGVQRIYVWIQEVRRAQSSCGGMEPISESVPINSESTQQLLGQQDDIGSPPTGYSPRVSNVGSDDGRKGRF